MKQAKRSDTTVGFVPVKRRWVVEQTHGTLMLHRRLVREYESRPASVHLVGVHRDLIRRLTGTTTPSWRDP